MVMSLKDQPLQRRDNSVLSTEVHKYIQEFINFLGAEAVAKAIGDLGKNLSHHGRCYRMWLQQVHPWLFTLLLYNQISTRRVQSWPVQIQQLVGDAFMIVSLAKQMPEEVKEKYRKDLLTIQHSDFLFEIIAAWHYHLQGYDIEWYPLGHEKGTEFRVQGGGIDFDVECRRFTVDIWSRVKMGTMADICDIIDDVLQENNCWGEVTVAFSDDWQFDPALASLWKPAIKSAMTSKQTHLQLAGGPLLTLKLNNSPSPKYARHDLSKCFFPSATTWILAKGDGSSCFDPVIFCCQGMRKTTLELRDLIYKTLRDKIKKQLSDFRAGIVFVRFTGIDNPRIFNESVGMQGIIRRLFKHNKLAAMIFICDDASEPDDRAIIHTSPGILFRNELTSHRDVADANHWGKHVN